MSDNKTGDSEQVARKRRSQTVLGPIKQVWTHSHFECDICGFEGDSYNDVVENCDCNHPTGSERGGHS